MAELAVDVDGDALVFDPLDYETQCGNMGLWNDTKGGMWPWDENYYKTDSQDFDCGFDPDFKARHATDSASTAGSMSTGTKGAVNMMGVNLYEEKVSLIIEDAQICGKAGGIISSVPMLHATPAAFVTHTNYRKNGRQMQQTWMKTSAHWNAGHCASRYYPAESDRMKMEKGGHLSKTWTALYAQMNGTKAKKFSIKSKISHQIMMIIFWFVWHLKDTIMHRTV